MVVDFRAMAMGNNQGRGITMWTYEKRLQYPVNIKKSDPQLAQMIITQYGGPNTKKIL